MGRCKARSNRIKHGISFEEAVAIFEGPILSSQDDRRDYGERRERAVGAIRAIVVVAVVLSNATDGDA